LARRLGLAELLLARADALLHLREGSLGLLQSLLRDRESVLGLWDGDLELLELLAERVRRRRRLLQARLALQQLLLPFAELRLGHRDAVLGDGERSLRLRHALIRLLELPLVPLRELARVVRALLHHAELLLGLEELLPRR